MVSGAVLSTAQVALVGAALAVGVAVGGGDPTPPTDDFSFGSVGGALALACVAAVPLGISIWALLDAARRPRWAWALTERRQVVWLAAICFGVLFVVLGLAVSGYYLWRVRPEIAAVEDGDV